MNTITVERLRHLIGYEPSTGAFSRLVFLRGQGKGVVGRINCGYLEIRVDGKKYQAHRLAWLHHYGIWPVGEIDHINGVADDNRIVNLRDVSRRANCENLRSGSRPRRNALPIGVFRRGRKFAAMIGTRGKQHYLGTFETPDAAHSVYIEAKRRLHKGSTL